MDHAKNKTIIEELLKALAIKFDVVEHIDIPDSKHARFMVKTEESALLIGPKGENLGAFNYLVRKIAAKRAGPDAEIRFFVDVNGYHEKALETVKAKAKVMSERARSFRVDIELEPMSSYERMLIHSYLEGASDIKTESTGEGSSRRVVIKYISS